MKIKEWFTTKKITSIAFLGGGVVASIMGIYFIAGACFGIFVYSNIKRTIDKKDKGD